MNEEELRKKVMREKGTEPPYTGKYLHEKRSGMYRCAGCGNELFTSEAKFDSGCGWPSFDRPVSGKSVENRRDLSHFMVRTEVICPKCGGHLGHVFDDGPTETGKRYCMNSVALNFTPKEEK
jgi:methionine-R-sulfoxide reductase